MRRASALLVLTALAGCTLPEGRQPIARITATPRAIQEHDSFLTPVELDASRSADPIDDPEGKEKLTYRWDIVGDDVRWDSGDDASVKPVVRFLGDHPATLLLTVTDESGADATARLQMQLTVPTP